MSIVADVGAVVAPGEVLYTEPAAGMGGVAEPVVAGRGTYARLVDAAGGSGAERHIVSLRLGVAQWDGPVISVYPRSSQAGAEAVTGTAIGAAASTAVFGPRPGDTVHVRVTRLTRLSAAGEIIAINGAWCSGSVSLGRQGAFRGIIRVEDVRPFKPTKDQLQPPPPSLAFQPGDIAIAEIISQSDVRQYQLSTTPVRCGVVESTVMAGDHGSEVLRKLEHIPGRRDAMVNPADGSVHYRWTPLLEL